MREKLLQMSAQWDELDQFCVNRLEGLAGQVETTAADLVDDAECVGEVR